MTGENTVDVDEHELAAQLEAVEIPEQPGAAIEQTAAPGAAGTPAAPAGEPTWEQLQAAIPMWKMGSDIVTNLLCDVGAPNWNITAAERAKVSDSISMALEAWFPGQYVPVRYQALFGVGIAVWAIVTARREGNGGKLPPPRLPAPGKTAGKEAPPPAQPAAGSAVMTSDGVTASG